MKEILKKLLKMNKLSKKFEEASVKIWIREILEYF